MKSYKNPIIIFNPRSGGGRCGRKFKKIYKYFLKKKLFDKIDVFEATCKSETIDKIQSIHSEKKNDLIITLGGDGSISTVCNGLMKIDFNERLPLLPIPTCSWNLLLLDFNIKKIKDSIKNLLNNDIKIFDVLSVENIKTGSKNFCINILGLGFISNIVKYGDSMFKNMGVLRYLLGTFSALKEFKPYKTIIKYNNGKDEFSSDRVYFISLSNTKYTGGKILISPDSKYDDGLMDIMILHDINRIKYMKGFLKAYSGKHIFEKGCKYFKTNEAIITSTPDFELMPDGELDGSSPVKVKVISKQIKMVV